MSYIINGLRRTDRALRRSSFALACVALFVALGGHSYAAGLIGGDQIKQGAVRSKHVKNGSLTGKDVKNGSLTAKDIKLSTLDLKGQKGEPGPKGDPGLPGPKGDPGPQGPVGPSTAYATSRIDGPDDIAAAPAYSTVRSLVVPAGHYAINAKLQLNDSGNRVVRCQLGFVVNGVFVVADEAVADMPDTVGAATIALQHTDSAPAGRAYTVRCRRSDSGSGTVNVNTTKITAIKLGSIVAG